MIFPLPSSPHEDAERVGIEDPGWNKVELERAVLVDDGVPGVVAALEPDDEIRLLRQEVGDLSLAFVAPRGRRARRD